MPSEYAPPPTVWHALVGYGLFPLAAGGLAYLYHRFGGERLDA